MFIIKKVEKGKKAEINKEKDEIQILKRKLDEKEIEIINREKTYEEIILKYQEEIRLLKENVRKKEVENKVLEKEIGS